MSDHSARLNWVTVGALALFHAGAMAALFLFTWQALWVALALLWISGGWGIGMGYHRLLTHRGYQTPRWLERTLTVCATLALQGGPLFWVATHRLHHQNADKNGDPHSPREGWWWSHAGWLVRGDPMRDTALGRYVPDLRRDPFHCWLEKWHVVPLLVLSVILATWGAVRGGAFLAASLVSWAIFLRTTVELHGTWLVNSAAHTWGSRRFETRDDSTNNWWVALLTFGEGWHNNHHADPRCVRHGLAWYELDINWLCIHALHRVGLARNLCLGSKVCLPDVQALGGNYSEEVAPRVPETKDILAAMPNHPLPSSTIKDPVTWLYPPIEPYRTGRLAVSPVHEIYFEESGNPSGKPVIFLHGGPGGGSDPKQRRFFHPEKYRIVNFDQRGCGKSTPYASLEANTTWDLVADIEKIREHLGIERWQVFGGSWGSTLALAYSQTHPDRTTEIVLRGIFLLRKQEIDWFYQRGASVLFPDAWEPYLAHIAEDERRDLLSAYHRRLTSDDPAVRLAAAKIWSGWEGVTSKLLPDPTFAGHYEEDEFALAFARIEVHYFLNKGFFEADDQLLRNASRIRHIPGVIVQGRYDVVCPMESAWALHRAWPEAELIITPDSGHSAFDPPNSRALVAATDRLAFR